MTIALFRKLGFFIACLGLFAVGARADAKQDFTLHNETGVEIQSLYVSPADSDDWEEDVLGQDTLEQGQSVHIRFSRQEKADFWDIKVTDKDGNSLEWHKLKLSEISDVTLYYKDGDGTAKVE